MESIGSLVSVTC